jgi:two-component system CheB/CheR fusion protein
MSRFLETVSEHGEARDWRSLDPGPVVVHAAAQVQAKIVVIDDEYFVREGICDQLRDAGWQVEAFSSCEAFLSSHRSQGDSCVVLDIHFPAIGGLDLLRRMDDWATRPPVIAVSGSSVIADAVQSMKLGALDFIEKPVVGELLVASVKRALAGGPPAEGVTAPRAAASGLLNELTARQRQILALVLAGQPSKNIAADLGISQRTVENHRAAIMHRTGARSLPALAQLVMCSGCSRSV